ncbi:MAG: hypothetical protein Q4F10_10190 [Corynebacterium glutamicum]|nr:hypothetical protein [Corynebacterium glutamicum]
MPSAYWEKPRFIIVDLLTVVAFRILSKPFTVDDFGIVDRNSEGFTILAFATLYDFKFSPNLHDLFTSCVSITFFPEVDNACLAVLSDSDVGDCYLANTVIPIAGDRDWLI